MLVLSRQRDETIMIGDEIEITVVEIRGDKVRLGITAPTRIAVHRKEVYDAIRAENQRAAQINPPDMDVLRRSISPGPGRTRTSRPPSIATLTGGKPAPLPPQPGAGTLPNATGDARSA